MPGNIVYSRIYITMTSWWERMGFKSPASWLSDQPFVEAQIKGNSMSSAALAFVKGIHRWLVNSPHKGSVTRTRFHLMTSSWCILGNATTLSQSPIRKQTGEYDIQERRSFALTARRLSVYILITNSMKWWRKRNSTVKLQPADGPFANPPPPPPPPHTHTHTHTFLGWYWIEFKTSSGATQTKFYWRKYEEIRCSYKLMDDLVYQGLKKIT